MRKKIILIIVAVIAAAALLGYSILSGLGYPRVRQLQAQVDRLESDKKDLNQQIQKLEQQVEALKAGGAYRLKIVRDELGYLRDDEVIVDLDGAPNPATPDHK